MTSRVDPMVLYRPTGTPLYLDGAMGLDELFDGAVTQNRVPSRSYVASAITQKPYRGTITALVSQHPTLAPQVTTQGAARWDEVEWWLREVKEAGTLVRMQRPGRSQVADLIIETFAIRQGPESTLDLTISVTQVRIARTAQVQLAPRPPRPDKAPGLTDETDGGPRNVSLLQGGINSAQDLAGYAAERLAGLGIL